MSSAPNQCPMCGALFLFWKPVVVNSKGLSAGKALLGGFLLGSVGAVVGGLMGKKQTTYMCENVASHVIMITSSLTIMKS